MLRNQFLTAADLIWQASLHSLFFGGAIVFPNLFGKRANL